MAITGAMVAADAVPFNNADILIDQTPSSSSFLAVESWATSISVSGGDTPVSNFNTFTVPLVFIGNINPFTVTVEMAYTEAAITNPFKEIYDDYIASPGLLYDVKWHPEGAAAGNYIFTTSGGRLISCSLPQGSSTGTSPSLFTITIQCSSIAVTVGV